ncbi:hypothetical protein, partial [Paracoccus sp. (in: a-proteobacteria)]|uniref:hypothetical protein n=1 Tax=Paracoccus sp. TaxID=267 RepID=UPI004059E83C
APVVPTRPAGVLNKAMRIRIAPLRQGRQPPIAIVTRPPIGRLAEHDLDVQGMASARLLFTQWMQPMFQEGRIGFDLESYRFRPQPACAPLP